MPDIDDLTLNLMARLINPATTTLRGFVVETTTASSSCRRVRSGVRSEAAQIASFLAEGAGQPLQIRWITWDSLLSAGVDVRADGSWKVAARRYGTSFLVSLPVKNAQVLARFLQSWLNWGAPVPLPERVTLRMLSERQ